MSDIDLIDEIDGCIPQQMSLESIQSGKFDYTDYLDEMVDTVQNFGEENGLQDDEVVAILSAQMAARLSAEGETPKTLLLQYLVAITIERLSFY